MKWKLKHGSYFFYNIFMIFVFLQEQKLIAYEDKRYMPVWFVLKPHAVTSYFSF